MKGSWESLVFYVNPEKTAEIRKLAADAQWFEDRMPWAAQYRKQGVRGITANAIDVVIETGDSGPITPVGINLPNDQNVREKHGSKSVSLSNVIEAYDRSTAPEFRREFSWTPEEAARAEKWSSVAAELTTNMHEVIGHASGKIADRLKGNPSAALKEQYSALEEARADLVALYFLPNPKLAELGLVAAQRSGGDRPGRVRGLHAQRAGPAAPHARGHADRGRPHAQPPDDRALADGELEGDRRPRSATARPSTSWSTRRRSRTASAGCSPKSSGSSRKVTTRRRRRCSRPTACTSIRSLRDEIVARVDHLNMPSYTGFVQPKLTPVTDADGTITDVKISYPMDLTTQMLEYSGRRK